MTPVMTILVCDENVKANYTMTYKAKGGGQVYSYSVSNEDVAKVDNDGHVFTEPISTPVSFTVKAFMPKSEANFAASEVMLPSPFLEEIVDCSVGIFSGPCITCHSLGDGKWR